MLLIVLRYIQPGYPWRTIIQISSRYIAEPGYFKSDNQQRYHR